MDTRKITVKILGLLLLALAGMLLADMQQRYADLQLWGYRPLWFYLSAYGGLVLLLYPFDFAQPPPPEDKELIPEAVNRLNSSRALLYSTATGLLLGLGFPGIVPFPFLLLFAFVPLLLLQKELRLSGAADYKVFFHGLHAFLLYNILATYWVTNTAFAPGVFAVVANALLMCIPWMLFHWTSKQTPKFAYLALPAYWIAFEWGHYNWDLNWPWLTLGNGFAEFPSLIQWYSYTGALGGGIWIWAFNLFVLRTVAATPVDFLWSTPGGSPYHALAVKGRSLPWWVIPILIIPPIFSVYSFRTNKPVQPDFQSDGVAKSANNTEQAAPGRTIKVVAVQPNFEPHFEKFSIPARATLDTFLNISEAALAAHPEIDYLIFPETSFDSVDEDDILASRDLRLIQDRLGNRGIKYLVTGYDGYHIFGPGETRSPAVRTSRNNPQLEFEALNAALQLDLQSPAVQSYRKGVFVPGAESFPFRDYLGFALPLVDALGGSPAGRGTQQTRDPFVSPLAKIAPVICYESVFGEFFTGYINEGAQAAFVMTNDGWWDNTSGYKQHLYISSLRAIETRRAVVRSANVGATAFIDRRGHIQQSTEYNRAGYLYGEVLLNDELTFYVHYGDKIPLILTVLSMLFLIQTLYLRLRPARSQRRDD
ncbi:apolipoprotein N-acyltransferase [Lewinellaceae bacterium SD302]|nr:apolipoprotein N-acyltransferase [Lewinellaceae bacterium SD302]